jgi:RimJ/RimL family protein N-acetyltransferase
MLNQNFSITPIRESDFAWFNECRNLVRNFLHNNSFFTYEQTQNFLTKNINSYWIVSLNENRIGYFRAITDLEQKKIMIGLDIHPDYQGRKYSKQIYRLFMQKMYNDNEIISYYLRVLKFNKKAINLYIALGFKITEETDLDLLMTFNYENNNDVD